MGHRIVSIVAAVWWAVLLTGTAQAEPLRIFYFAWVGYGPFFLAQEKGFFADEGVEVELIHNEVHARRLWRAVQRPSRRPRRRRAGCATLLRAGCPGGVRPGNG